MYRARVDGGQLHRLGKRLIELSARVTGEAGDLVLTPGEAAVIEDVIKHPDGSISEIHQRTGFVQSHVSASVSRLRERGLVEVAADPDDGRRTRVRVVDQATQAIARRAARGIDGTIGRAVTGPDEARRVVALLEELADLLL
jgi:DNA-binding MarR family transcriptional regulator